MPEQSKLLQNPGALCNMVRRIAIEAGEIVMHYYEAQDEFGLEEKPDGSPVTLADREAEIYIQGELEKILPGIPVVGEEGAAGGNIPDIGGQRYFWLVDPLDGTKEFIEGGTEFTVNIALVQDGRPFLGVVFAPVKGVMYAGYGPDKAIRWSEDNPKDKDVSVRPPPERGLTVVSSKSHGDRARLDHFLENFKIDKIIKKGSSLKICAIAEGKADIYGRFGATCEWDTAAAHAVLYAAGGEITDLEGNPLTYGGARQGFLNPEFIASSFDWRNTD